jgi:hypothetical protein
MSPQTSKKETSPSQPSPQLELEEEELQELNPEDFELPDSIELTTRKKYAGKPKVRANTSRPQVGSHGPKISTPTFGTVRGEYN